MAHVQHSTVIPVNRKDLYEFLSDYRKRPRLMPPDLELELTSVPLDLKKGAEYEFNLKRFGLNYAFTIAVESCTPYEQILERASFAFFEEWLNTTKFEEHGENSTLLTTLIDYKLPMGFLGTLADDLFVKGDLQRVVKFTHRKLKSFFV